MRLKICTFYLLITLILMSVMRPEPVRADPAASDETPSWYSLHAQATDTFQAHPAFASSIADGPNSMKARGQVNQGNDLTLYAGLRYRALEIYANPEVNQGFGLSNAVGVAGFPNGESSKVGSHEPYFRMQRLFGRSVLDLGQNLNVVEDDINQVATRHDAHNLTFTFGKFSVVDLFDVNSYAHDAKNDFLNWSIIDMGAFDYAADAWGYSYGGALEWNEAWWTLRSGLFDMSRVPNGPHLTRGFGDYQMVLEAEERHKYWARDGKIKALVYLSNAHMGAYDEALAVAQRTGNLPSLAQVRRWQTKVGGGLNAEQGITDDVSLFARASLSDGRKETYEFTEINRSISAGTSLKGTLWGCAADGVGLAGALNGLSSQARRYVAAGGQGIMIGDGQLPSYAGEKVMEAYYKANITHGFDITGDYQYVANPAYDAARGPIHFFALRAHLDL